MGRLVHLQRTIGNRAVQRLVQTRSKELLALRLDHALNRNPAGFPEAGTVQRKLAINHPGDEYEQEAERAAAQVMRMSETQLQRACACGGKCPECRKEQREQDHEHMQTKRAEASDTGQLEAPPIVDEVLATPGQALDSATQDFMEPRFGRSFDQVRVHTDAKAAESAGAVNALAYTAGRHVVFGDGHYKPSTNAGRQLLAHELAHVVQQGASTSALQRYSHQDCTASDLRTHIWPADGIAKNKVAAAIAALTASPVSATTAALFNKYFMTSTPNVATIARVFRAVKAAFDGDSYTYECEDDCDPGENAYSGHLWDIHLCMNNIRGRANDCIARTIIHEFTHKYAGTGHGWWFSTAHCYNACDTAGCPSDLSASDALDNAYSYAGFAYEV